MTFDAWFSIAIMIFCFATLMLSRVSPDIVMSAGLTLLLFFEVLTPQEALAGFANEGMLTVAVLYIVVAGLTETGAVGWIVHSLLGRPRNMPHAQFRLMLPVAVLSAWVVAFRRAPMAMEAASSRAETTRVPEESFASERVAIVSEAVRFRWATFAA